MSDIGDFNTKRAKSLVKSQWDLELCLCFSKSCHRGVDTSCTEVTVRF